MGNMDTMLDLLMLDLHMSNLLMMMSRDLLMACRCLHRLHMVQIIDNLMGFVNPDDEVYSLPAQATRIARGVYLNIIIICILCSVLLIYLHKIVY